MTAEQIQELFKQTLYKEGCSLWTTDKSACYLHGYFMEFFEACTWSDLTNLTEENYALFLLGKKDGQGDRERQEVSYGKV